jgi:hypothetical protein
MVRIPQRITLPGRQRLDGCLRLGQPPRKIAHLGFAAGVHQLDRGSRTWFVSVSRLFIRAADIDGIQRVVAPDRSDGS